MGDDLFKLPKLPKEYDIKSNAILKRAKKSYPERHPLGFATFTAFLGAFFALIAQPVWQLIIRLWHRL